MRVLIPVLLATTAIVPSEAYASEGGGAKDETPFKGYYEFCKDGSSKSTDDEAIKLCEAAAKALRDREQQYVSDSNIAKLSEAKCLSTLRLINGRVEKFEGDDFDRALEKFKSGGKSESESAQQKQSISCDSSNIASLAERIAKLSEDKIDEADEIQKLRLLGELSDAASTENVIQAPDIGVLASTFDRFANDQTLPRELRETFYDLAYLSMRLSKVRDSLDQIAVERRFATNEQQRLQQGIEGLQSASVDRKIATDFKKYPSRKLEEDAEFWTTEIAKAAVTLDTCSPIGKIIKTDESNTTVLNRALLFQPEQCRNLAETMAKPIVGWDRQDKVDSPGDFSFTQEIQTSKSGSNIKLGGQWVFSRVEEGFHLGGVRGKKEKVPVRRPRSWTWTGSIEGEADGNIANIIGGNSGTGDNFFSLSRLNSKFAANLSLGFNLYPRQTLSEFEDERDKFLKKAQAQCLKSLAENTTNIITNCEDSDLLVWLYEAKDGKYARESLVDDYNKLIWQSSAPYPQFGVGLSGSLGFPDRDYQDFLDADGAFDLMSVDIDQFFGSTTQRRAYAERVSGTSYTIGTYGFFHSSLPQWDWTKGATTVVRATYKRDLPDNLDKKRIQLCNNSAAGLGAITASPINPGDTCRTVLPFEPKFEESVVGEFEFRLSLDKLIRKMGIAPSFSYQANFDAKNKYRIDFPIYFTAEDDDLTGGVGWAREVDLSLTEDRGTSSIYIFFGRKFSLDGSK